jgi:hypothetical protein
LQTTHQIPIAMQRWDQKIRLCFKLRPHLLCESIFYFCFLIFVLVLLVNKEKTNF